MARALKLLIAEQDVAALRQHPLLVQFAATDPHDRQIADTYFDTPDWHVRRAQASLRVRCIDKTWLQTLKAGGRDRDGERRLQVWETPVGGAAPQLAPLRDQLKKSSPLGKLLREPGIADRIVPLFTVHRQRRVWTLRLARGDLVECTLDVGQMVGGEMTLPIAEVALRMQSGDPARLYEIALGLQRDLPFRLASASHAERGYALLRPQVGGAVKAEPVTLHPNMTVEHAFIQITANCITQIAGNDEAILRSNDGEALHQMRVGVRRLRAALKLFGKELPVPAALASEVDWLGKELGPARDWDVLASSTLEVVAKAAPADIVLSELSAAARSLAHARQLGAAEAVGSARYTRLFLLLGGWLSARGWRDSLMPQQKKRLAAPVSRFADAVFAQSQRRLRRRGRAWQAGDQAMRHRLRIAAKTARYAAEFFQALAPSKHRRYTNILSEMQETLGWLNDAANAGSMLKELPQHDDGMIGSVAFARGYLLARGDADNGAAQRRWKQFMADS